MYRVRQFFGALAARIDEEDQQLLSRWLTPSQQALFRRMAPNDQRHSLNVCAALRRAGYDDPDLLAAALLHDVGKAAGRIWLWQRTLIVLLRRWSPRTLAWLERGTDYARAPRWRRGFVINKLHPELGARWARETRCAPVTVTLVQRHQVPVQAVRSDQERLLAALQWADGVN